MSGRHLQRLIGRRLAMQETDYVPDHPIGVARYAQVAARRRAQTLTLEPVAPSHRRKAELPAKDFVKREAVQAFDRHFQQRSTMLDRDADLAERRRFALNPDEPVDPDMALAAQIPTPRPILVLFGNRED